MDVDKVYGKYCEFMSWKRDKSDLLVDDYHFKRKYQKIELMSVSERINYYFFLEDQCERYMLDKLSS